MSGVPYVCGRVDCGADALALIDGGWLCARHAADVAEVTMAREAADRLAREVEVEDDLRRYRLRKAVRDRARR